MGAQVWEEALGDGVEQGFSNGNVLETQLGTFLHGGVRLIWPETTSSRVVVMWLAGVPSPLF